MPPPGKRSSSLHGASIAPNQRSHVHTLVALSKINPRIPTDNLKEYSEINGDGM